MVTHQLDKRGNFAEFFLFLSLLTKLLDWMHDGGGSALNTQASPTVLKKLTDIVQTFFIFGLFRLKIPRNDVFALFYVLLSKVNS